MIFRIKINFMRYLIYLLPIVFLFSCEHSELPELTDDEIVQGLKEALKVGTDTAVTNLNRENGFFEDEAVKILIPEEVRVATDKLRKIGLNSLVDNFEKSLNRAAEDAADEAKPIFLDAITSITFSEARQILEGPDDAATQYFKDKTYDKLYNAFKPDIKQSLDKVNATQYWEDIATTYNAIPLVDPVETDLPKYTTEKALDGLFLKVQDEEKSIREDPKARVTSILEKVFGSVNN